jgi:hypothetical protein
MKKPSLPRGEHRFAAAALIAAALMLPISANAGTIEGARQTCTTINCNATILPGTLNKHEWNLSGGSTATIPRIGAGSWVMSVRAGLNECLRLDIVKQGTYMELVVVSPSAVIWRNERRGGTTGCVECPLVKISNTNQSGYYVVQVNHRTGYATDAGFSLAYGRYNSGNPNCAAPTPPLQ